MSLLHRDRLFPSDPTERAIARRLYGDVAGLPIVSPHGHTDPSWFAENKPFEDPARLFVTRDHYIFRMLYSQGVRLEDLGIRRLDGAPVETDPRAIWRRFAERYHLFRGTPTRMWLDHAFETLFGLTDTLAAGNADAYYDAIAQALTEPRFLPRSLFESFNIEVLATTESPLDDLRWHEKIRTSGWRGRVVTAYRPDPVVDPDFFGFVDNLAVLGDLTAEDTSD
jgi:glucuronate isomerase